MHERTGPQVGVVVDWNLRICARRGYLTYAPTEEQLRVRLRAETPEGPAWRCLRCGDFVLGPPRGSGAATDAPTVLRGPALRQLVILRILAVERVLRGTLLLLIAYLIWRFSRDAASLRQVFETDLPLLRPLADAYGYDLTSSPLVATIRRIFAIRPETLIWAILALAVYAVVQYVEGVGLWLGKRWAEYLTVIATSAFLPFEIYELVERVTPLRVLALVINLAAVAYLIIAKRLFRVRGGAAAVERERQTHSIIEVQEAAA